MFNHTISNRTHYNKEMQKSLIDKAFFLDKVDSDIYVDFGCADGMLLGFMETMFPDAIYIGYDISVAELDIAKTNTNAKLFSDWDELVTYLNSICDGKSVTVICNSLIHEVYAYGNKQTVDEFWQRLFGGTFDNIVIRDMAVSKTVNRQSDPISVAKIRQCYDKTRLQEFEAQWGNIDSNWSLVHFILKYRYVENWKREVLENYLPLNYEDLLAIIPQQYTPVYVDHFSLPYIRQQAQIDLGIDLQERTHIKLILKKV